MQHPEKRSHTLRLAIALLTTAALACTCLPSVAATPSATPPPPSPSAVPRTAAPPTTAAAPSPTQPLPSATPESVPGQIFGPDISFNGVSFTLDPAVADSVYLQTPSDAWDVSGWTGFWFSPEGWCEAGCVNVYPVNSFLETIPGGADVIAELRAALQRPATTGFPIWGAGILVQAQTELLDFASGHGIRSLVMAGQATYWVSNESLKYMFLGQTADGEYVVSVQLPIRAPFLLDGRDPQTNTNPDAMPLPDLASDPTLWDQAVMAYNHEAEVRLEALDPAGFTPDLQVLDALIGSLQVGDDYQQFPAPTEEPG
jgi:hypothetical protein